MDLVTNNTKSNTIGRTLNERAIDVMSTKRTLSPRTKQSLYGVYKSKGDLELNQYTDHKPERVADVLLRGLKPSSSGPSKSLTRAKSHNRGHQRRLITIITRLDRILVDNTAKIEADQIEVFKDFIKDNPQLEEKFNYLFRHNRIMARKLGIPMPRELPAEITVTPMFKQSNHKKTSDSRGDNALVADEKGITVESGNKKDESMIGERTSPNIAVNIKPKTMTSRKQTIDGTSNLTFPEDGLRRNYRRPQSEPLHKKNKYLEFDLSTSNMILNTMTVQNTDTEGMVTFNPTTSNLTPRHSDTLRKSNSENSTTKKPKYVKTTDLINTEFGFQKPRTYSLDGYINDKKERCEIDKEIELSAMRHIKAAQTPSLRYKGCKAQNSFTNLQQTLTPKTSDKNRNKNEITISKDSSKGLKLHKGTSISNGKNSGTDNVNLYRLPPLENGRKTQEGNSSDKRVRFEKVKVETS
ncbi:unnamed protein product [Owenia fusiformis]|uniref:Uncharacterized protein n=1 Tax=Owenia fusiformis TaxID=6347 RepID=A0A8S4NNR6_OWEFU|nr:unnamed protein product [Owenia fusiformis]